MENLSTLQAVADKVNNDAIAAGQPNPNYQAYLFEGNDPGGIDVFAASPEQFSAALTSTNHTLKRALTDPRIFSGIGNAYSDEILHQAKLSPVALTQRMGHEEIGRLLEATRSTLSKWAEVLRAQAGDKFPEKVTGTSTPTKMAPKAPPAAMRR